MAERYESQVKEVGLPGARVQNHIDGAAAGVQVAEAMGGMARPLQNLGLVIQEKQDEFDRTRALELYNKYQKDVSEFHFNPDSGAYATYKGSKAGSLYNDADKFMLDTAQKYEGEIKNPKVLNAFKGMVQSLQLRQNESNMKVQFKEIETYKAEQSDATIKLGLTEIGRNYDNDAAVEGIRAEMDMALWNQYGTASPEAQRLAQNKMDNDIAIARISPMIKQDPMAAKGWFDAHRKEFLPEVAEKVEGILGTAIEDRQMYAMVEVAMSKFPPGASSPQAAAAWILQNASSPEQGDKIVSHYRQRRNWLEVDESAKAASMTKIQNANYEALYAQYPANGQAFPPDLLRREQAAGNLSSTQVEKALKLNERFYDAAKIKKDIAMDPAFKDKGPDAIFAEAQRRKGISKEQGMAYFYNLRTGIMEDRYTKSDIITAREQLEISDRDADRLLKIESTFGKDQRGFFNTQRRELEADLKKSKFGQSIPAEFSQSVIGIFAEKVEGLNPADPKYRDNIVQARKEAVVEAMDGYKGRKNSPMKSLIDGYSQMKPDELDNMDYKNMMRPEPSSAGGDLASGFNGLLVSTYKSTKGKGYLLGGKDISKSSVDCSGLVCSIVSQSMDAMNTAAGGAVFNKDAMKAISGASADIIENVAKKTGWGIQVQSATQLREGMIIGLDNDPNVKGGRGYKHIDHVAVVVRDPGTGALMAYESSSSGWGKAPAGVKMIPLESYVSHYSAKGTPIYAVNPLLMAQDPKLINTQKKKDPQKDIPALNKAQAATNKKGVQVEVVRAIKEKAENTSRKEDALNKR